MALVPHQIPNPNDPSKPFTIINFSNCIKLSPTNYITWKNQVESHLIGHDLVPYVDGSLTAPPSSLPQTDGGGSNPAYTTWRRQDHLLKGGLIGTLSSSVASLVTRATTSREIWTYLESTYAKPSRAHIGLLKERLNAVSLGSKSVTDFIHEVSGISDLLAQLGKPQDQEDITEVILKGLDSNYQALIDGIRARDSPISLIDLHEKLLTRETFLKFKDSSSSTSSPTTVMSMSYRPNKPKQPKPSSPYPNPPPQMSQPRPQQWVPPPNQPLTDPNRRPFLGRCQWCRTQGHVLNFCPSFRQAAPHLRPPANNFRPPQSTQQPPQAHFASTQNNTQPWLVDSGATHHVTNDLSNLALHQPYDGPDELQVGSVLGKHPT